MQCNRNAMNTRVIRGNQYTQDMMDPRGFIMDQGECNYDNFAVSQPLPPQPPQQVAMVAKPQLQQQVPAQSLQLAQPHWKLK